MSRVEYQAYERGGGSGKRDGGLPGLWDTSRVGAGLYGISRKLAGGGLRIKKIDMSVHLTVNMEIFIM